jgi:hypothetical protein
MSIRNLLTLAALLVAPTAAVAGPDLSTSMTSPANDLVEGNSRYTITVRNVGNQRSATGTLTVQLPLTHTSPTVHVLGTVGALSNGCSRVGTTISCAVGRIQSGNRATFTFDYASRQSSDPVEFRVTVRTTGGENSLANNDLTHVDSRLNYAIPVAGPWANTSRHCTGRDLTSFLECELYPSSITSHPTTLLPTGEIDFGSPAINAVYTGTWSQPSPDRLVFQYFDYGVLAADFDGYGVPGGCFEGLTVFPDSEFVSIYEVCPR